MITDRLGKPAAAKWDGASVHRRVITPKPERGIVSIAGPDDLYYAHTVGTFGVVSAGQNWDRLDSAAHSWALKVVGAKEVFFLLFPDGALAWRMVRSLRRPFW